MRRGTPLLLAGTAALVLTGCGGGGDDGPAVAAIGAGADQTVTIDMNDKNAFVPTTVTAGVGTLTIEVKNVGRIPHNLVFDQQGLGKTKTIAGDKNELLAVTFDKAGTYTFVCTFHPGMDGKVVVSG